MVTIGSTAANMNLGTVKLKIKNVICGDFKTYVLLLLQTILESLLAAFSLHTLHFRGQSIKNLYKEKSTSIQICHLLNWGLLCIALRLHCQS